MSTTSRQPVGAGMADRLSRYRHLVRQAANPGSLLSAADSEELSTIADELELDPGDFPADVSAIVRDRLYEDRLVSTLQREIEARRRLHAAQLELSEIVCDRHEIEREQHAARRRCHRLWGRLPPDHLAE